MLYRYDEPRRSRLSSVTCYIGNAFAIFGGVALLALVIDSFFFNNNGLINLLIWVWEATN